MSKDVEMQAEIFSIIHKHPEVNFYEILGILDAIKYLLFKSCNESKEPKERQ